MSEIQPTLEDLENPYVLQLIERIAMQDDIIEAYRAFIRSLDVTPHPRLRDQIEEILGDG